METQYLLNSKVVLSSLLILTETNSFFYVLCLYDVSNFINHVTNKQILKVVGWVISRQTIFQIKSRALKSSDVNFH